MCLDTSQLTVYCYECDEFVVNDTQDRLEFLEQLAKIKIKHAVILVGFWKI